MLSSNLPKPVPVSPTKTLPVWVVPVLLAGTALLLLGIFTTEVGDPDFWWHLKTGQFILTEHRLPVPDPFAYTTAAAGSAYPGEESVRRFNLTHEWLAQAIWYVVYKISGFAGVVFWKGLLLLLLCAITGHL